MQYIESIQNTIKVDKWPSYEQQKNLTCFLLCLSYICNMIVYSSLIFIYNLIIKNVAKKENKHCFIYEKKIKVCTFSFERQVQ